MTPTEKFDHTVGTARERYAKNKISFGAYSAILTAARADRDRSASASSVMKRASVRPAPPPSRPSAPPPSKPQPRAKKREFLLPLEPKVTAAEREAAIAGAMAVMREGDAYLKLLEREDDVQAFAERAERVTAQLENRPVRKRPQSGPPQPALTPMSDAEFGAMWSRVQRIVDGG